MRRGEEDVGEEVREDRGVREVREITVVRGMKNLGRMTLRDGKIVPTSKLRVGGGDARRDSCCSFLLYAVQFLPSGHQLDFMFAYLKRAKRGYEFRIGKDSQF